MVGSWAAKLKQVRIPAQDRMTVQGGVAGLGVDSAHTFHERARVRVAHRCATRYVAAQVRMAAQARMV